MKINVYRGSVPFDSFVDEALKTIGRFQMIEAVEAGGGSAMNQTHVKNKKIKKKKTRQLIKRSNPTNGTDQTDLPSKRNRSNPLPINPSTATEFRSTHQTPCRSTHPPPPSSQIKPIKPTADQPIKPTADQPIHHHRVPKSRN